jgi:hypothetical protein
MEAAGSSEFLATIYETTWRSHVGRRILNRTDTLSVGTTKRSLPAVGPVIAAGAVKIAKPIKQVLGTETFSTGRLKLNRSRNTPPLQTFTKPEYSLPPSLPV